MSTATPFPSQERFSHPDAGITFRACFERSPLAAARCNSRGEIVDANPAFERMFDGVSSHEPLWDWLTPHDRAVAQTLLRELLEGTHDSICIPAKSAAVGPASASW